MKVSEEVDALEVMAIPSMPFLVTTRIVAGLIAIMPLYVVGLLSSYFATRLVVGDTLTRLRIPLVSAAAVQFQGQVGLFRGWEPEKPCYRCFVGDAFDSDDCDTCAEQGVLGALAATVGAFAALMAIRAIVGIGEDVAGSLFLFDGEALDWRKIRLPKDPNCGTCGSSLRA